GHWQLAATYQNGASLSYDIDYALAHMDADLPLTRIGMDYPINFTDYRENGWPAFLLDLLPAGAAREAWAKRISLRNDETADWPLLCFASGNSPGNLRITSSVIERNSNHPGFTRDEIVERNIDFIDYAEAHGAIIAGASCVQGQAPKFLLVQDHNERWHAEGALDDSEVSQHWLVKFPRGRKEADRTILRNEAPYYEVARIFGIRIGIALEYQDDALFIQRFDRHVASGNIDRYGLESITSLCGINTFGARLINDDICRAICRHVSDPQTELLEYLRRDILNLALGNTDNHGRNTALIKKLDRSVELSPLFDFAPMFLDPEGIPRVSRWNNETPGAMPDFGQVIEAVAGQVIAPAELRAWLGEEAVKVQQLPGTMKACGVDDEIIEKMAQKIADLERSLRKVGQ
ncbi:MAG: HipA domain-containing protein, partial [Desulfuromusa sp.]|nr:HipA domain-containing protein [Desulfuromusa sp.]